MIAETMSLNLKNIDKSDWKLFQFKDIAKRVTENVKPEEAEVDIYIGLEHLDGNDIHIRRKGVPSDVKGGKLRCYPGDVIFGKRRAYQRKAAIVDFDGICSAHAFVFRAKPKVMLPEFFPFFLHSDEFMHRMIDISVGGLSPTINWGDLKDQEFLLPPLDQQKQLAKLLWAMDEVIEKEKEVRERTSITLNSYSKKVFKSEKDKSYKLSELGEIIMGQSPPGSSYNEEGIGEPFLQGNAEFGELNPTFIKYTTDPKRLVMPGTILISVRAPVGDLNMANRKCCIGRGLAGIYIENEIIRNYVYEFLKYNRYELERHSTGSTFKSINKDYLTSLKIALPAKDKLKENIGKFDSLNSSIKLINSKIHSSEQLLCSLIHQIF